MNTATNEQTSTTEEYSSSRHSTPNSSGGGDKPFHFGSNPNIERGSGKNSRTSSVAESTSTNTEGFSNYPEIIQYLQTIWNNHNTPNESSRRKNSNTGSTSINDADNNETIPSHYSKGYSQQHYTHHQSGQYVGQQHRTNYNNPRRTGNYSRSYSGGSNDGFWNSKPNRYPTHRPMNSLMTNSANYQQSQSSPPTQRRQEQYHHNEQQTSQSYYKKKNRSDHDRRSNGYNSSQQQSSDYHQINTNVENFTPISSEQSDINSIQSFPSNLNSYNR